jgi:transposase InsO family protein
MQSSRKPDERRATDLCRIWGGRDGWLTLALVIDCYSRNLVGWQLSRSGTVHTAACALEQTTIARYCYLGRTPTPLLLRSDTGLVFTSRRYTQMVRHYGLRQEFNTPHCPSLNGMVERVIRTLKEQCVHRQRFEYCNMLYDRTAAGCSSTTTGADTQRSRSRSPLRPRHDRPTRSQTFRASPSSISPCAPMMRFGRNPEA